MHRGALSQLAGLVALESKYFDSPRLEQHCLMLNGRRARFPSQRSFRSTIPLEQRAQTSREDPAAPPAQPPTRALPAVKTNLPLAYAVEIKLPPRRTHRQDIRFLPAIGPRECVDIA